MRADQAIGLKPLPKHLLESVYLANKADLPASPYLINEFVGLGPYRLARRGVEVEMPRRRSTVYALDVITYTGDADRIDAVTLDLRVGSGTYVRAIAHALGGHCRTLRRTEVGPFTVAEAVAPEAFEAGRLLAEADVLARVRARP